MSSVSRLRARCGADALHQLADVLVRRSAAASDDVDAVLVHEGRELHRHRPRLERIARLSFDVDRQAGIRYARHRQRGVTGEVADRLAHVLGTGRAVEADHVDVQRLEDRERRRDVGPEQHAPRHVERHRRDDRDRASGRRDGISRAEHRGLRLQDVLLCLDDQHVDATLDERRSLLLEYGHEVREAEPAHRRVARRGQETGGSHAPGDEPLPSVHRVLVSDAARHLCGRHIELPCHVRLTPLLEARSRRLEGARLEDIASRIEETAMNPLDDLGRMEHETVHPSLEPRATEVIDRRVLELLARPHRAVENEHAVTERVKERRSISA